jgi:hypothetical protein
VGHPGLARAVGRARLGGGEAGDRGDVDDVAAPAAHHAGQRGHREPHDGVHVEREHLLLGLDAGPQERPVQAAAGVVDQQVDRGVGVGQPLLDPLAAGDGGEVGGEHRGADLVPVGQLGGEAGQARLVAGDEDEVVALDGEPARERRADARGRPGHQSGLP